jgi:hypothetical protein
MAASLPPPVIATQVRTAYQRMVCPVIRKGDVEAHEDIAKDIDALGEMLTLIADAIAAVYERLDSMKK